jgi:hypothetical protein
MAAPELWWSAAEMTTMMITDIFQCVWLGRKGSKKEPQASEPVQERQEQGRCLLNDPEKGNGV